MSIKVRLSRSGPLPLSFGPQLFLIFFICPSWTLGSPDLLASPCSKVSFHLCLNKLPEPQLPASSLPLFTSITVTQTLHLYFIFLYYIYSCTTSRAGRGFRHRFCAFVVHRGWIVLTMVICSVGPPISLSWTWASCSALSNISVNVGHLKCAL